MTDQIPGWAKGPVEGSAIELELGSDSISGPSWKTAPLGAIHSNLLRGRVSKGLPFATAHTESPMVNSVLGVEQSDARVSMVSVLYAAEKWVNAASSTSKTNVPRRQMIPINRIAGKSLSAVLFADLRRKPIFEGCPTEA